MRNARFFFVVALLLACPGRLFAQSNAYPLALTEEERILQEAESYQAPFGVSVGLGQTLGAATFNDNAGVRRPSLDMSISVSPYWRLTKLMRLTAGIGTSVALVESYDTNTTKQHQWYLSDLSLGLSHAQLAKIPGADIGVSGQVSLGFPTSLQSQYRELIMAMRAGLGFSRAFGPVYVSYGIGVFKNLNRYTSPTLSREEVGDHVILSHYQGNENLTSDLVALGGNNTSFGISNSLLVSYYIIDPLSFTVAYTLSNSWTYRSYSNDEYASEYADGGRGQRDSHSGVVDITYQFNDVYSLGLGVQTVAAPRTADNKGWTFPFLNFSNDYRSNTGIYLGFNAAF